MSAYSKNTKLFVVLLVALVLRLAVAIILPEQVQDLFSWQAGGEAILRGENPYVTLPHINNTFPYFPLWGYIEAVTVLLARTTGGFFLLIRLPGIAADIGVCLLIYRVVSEGIVTTRLSPIQATAAHAVNPIAVTVVSYHGQFDSLPILFLMLAIVLAHRQSWTFSALFLGMGIAFKPIPAFMGALFLASRQSWRKRVRYFLIATVPTVITSVPYLLDTPRQFVSATVGYKSSAIVSWFTLVLGVETALVGVDVIPLRIVSPYADQILTLSKVLLVGTVLGISWWYYRESDRISLWHASAIVILLFYSISAAVAPQYLYWVLPFIVTLRFPQWYRVAYTLIGLAAIGLTYFIWYNMNLLPTFVSGIPRTILIEGMRLASIGIFWLVALFGLYYLLVTATDSLAASESNQV